MNGIRIRWRRTPGSPVASAGVFPSFDGEGRDRRGRSRRRSAPARITSTRSEHRHRVEEVHADHPIRAPGCGCELRDRDRRGVRREDRLGREEARLPPGRPSSSLRHPRRSPRSSGRPARGCVAAEIRASTPPGSGRAPFACSFPRLRSIPARPRSTAPGGGVVEHDLPARRSDDLGDAGAHLAGADDEHTRESARRRAYPDAAGGNPGNCGRVPRRYRRTDQPTTTLRMSTPSATLIAVPRGSSATASRRRGSVSRQHRREKTAPSRPASTPTAALHGRAVGRPRPSAARQERGARRTEPRSGP